MFKGAFNVISNYPQVIKSFPSTNSEIYLFSILERVEFCLLNLLQINGGPLNNSIFNFSLKLLVSLRTDSVELSKKSIKAFMTIRFISLFFKGSLIQLLQTETVKKTI